MDSANAALAGPGITEAGSNSAMPEVTESLPAAAHIPAPTQPHHDLTAPSSSQSAHGSSTELHHIHRNVPDFTSRTGRLLAKIKRIKAKHKPATRSSKNEPWKGTAKVAFVDKETNSEVVRSGVIQFDSGCEDDFISIRFAQEEFNQNYGKTTPVAYGISMTGDTVYTVGQMDARWWVEVRPSRWSLLSKAPSVKPMYHKAKLLVVKSDVFDILIGSKTINKHGLFHRSNKFAAPGWRSAPAPAKTVKTITEEERKARERRAQELAEQNQHEQQNQPASSA
jgi:hypothetical protein